MKIKKGRGARKSRNTKNYLQLPSNDVIEVVSDLVRRAQAFYEVTFGGRDTTCLWGAEEVTPNTWLAFPMGSEPYCLTSPETGVAYEFSAHGVGLVCTAMAVASYKEGTKNRDVVAAVDDALSRITRILGTHPEREQIVAFFGMSE